MQRRTRPEPRLDEPREELVRQQPAARREDDPRVVGDLEELRRPSPSRTNRPGAARRHPPAAGRGPSGARGSSARRRPSPRRGAPRRPAAAAASRRPAGSAPPRRRRAGRRSSAGWRRRRRGLPARPPRTGRRSQYAGCGGSRGRVGPSSRSRSRASPPRPSRSTACWYCAAARSSSWAGRATSRQRRAPAVVGR